MNNNAYVNSTNGERYTDTDIIVIDKETESHHTYDVRFNTDVIRTIVTDTASIVDEWIHGVYKSFSDKLKDGNNLIVGLDIEWVRLREDNQNQRNRIAVLQLCSGNQCLIFQFFGCDKIPESLINFVNDGRIIFVGSGIDQDARKLWVDYGLNVAISEELGGLADYTLGRSDCYRSGLKSLMYKVFGEVLHKPRGITLSRWDYEFLKDEQVLYACIDAYASYLLGMELMPRREIVNKDGPKEDLKKTPQQTNQGQGPKAPNQGQGARAPNQVQGAKAPSQGQGARPRYSESRRIRKPTLWDFIV
ncbi:hypothetical protein MKW98_005970 [Papaver atlanticum]|uniref:3'-5' exonuclease domain-containing protein n=1 Tax=Papaver atlanticum TaxID=357466 RepID=A0AAD4S8N6_9MAGN|nr:hypothetical protein MKW98_005970 [Papaver atlanticum]